MKKFSDFISCNKWKILGFSVYYILYAAFIFVGTSRNWPMLLLNILLLLFLLSISVGGADDHYANYRAFRQQPLVAQDLKPTFSNFDGTGLVTGILLNLPPALYLLFRLLLRYIR